MKTFRGEEVYLLEIVNTDYDSIRRLYLICEMLWNCNILVKPTIGYDTPFNFEEE